VSTEGGDYLFGHKDFLEPNVRSSYFFKTKKGVQSNYRSNTYLHVIKSIYLTKQLKSILGL